MEKLNEDNFAIKRDKFVFFTPAKSILALEFCFPTPFYLTLP
jgi:hypothetical protein